MIIKLEKSVSTQMKEKDSNGTVDTHTKNGRMKVTSVVCSECKHIVDVAHTQVQHEFDPAQPYMCTGSRYICLDCCVDDDDEPDQFDYSYDGLSQPLE